MKPTPSNPSSGTARAAGEDWREHLNALRETDPDLARRITRKMIIYLCWVGIHEAQAIQQDLVPDEGYRGGGHENRPWRVTSEAYRNLSAQAFEIAARYLTAKEILSVIQKWESEDKASFLVKACTSLGTPLMEMAEALRRFQELAAAGVELPTFTEMGVRVALIRRFFTDQLEFLNVAKEFVEIQDFYELMRRMIFTTGSYGKLGGKSSGLFLAARILSKVSQADPSIGVVKMPKTWYIPSDTLQYFMIYNHMEDIGEQKYKEIDQIRREYGQIMQIFKNSIFPAEIVEGLSVALDDFAERPLIVRSSSLLEDRLGAAFSGKYKSLFLANQGTKQERLDALTDAIAEVYSSTFGPDPIEYRASRGYLDFHEEMGVMIQEVVGTRVGKYFLPAFAGVAFTNNEFRWSPRIRREDGLIRLVPGLGTRAVDRLSDDYPVLVAPGQPALRVNVTAEEVLRYSPNKIDVINLETNSFDTVDADRLLRECGAELPMVEKLVSIHADGQLREPGYASLDFEQGRPIFTFEGLISRTPFVKQVYAILTVLQEKIGSPVDVEFAHDGKDFYLLQCRPQSHFADSAPSTIPHGIPERDILFTARRYVSNGRVPDITHVVYVDPQRYGQVRELADLYEIGRIVGALNKILPRRQFILMGPGRWGSRGDIKLGVNVGYSDISNTAVLIEIARKTGKYVPDLSFGTHFFQDLVESSIRYLPLYPDDEGILFNERFLTRSHNLLPELLPEYARFADVVRAIDVPENTHGMVLRILMNAELDEAVGMFAPPKSAVELKKEELRDSEHAPSEEHWRWRLQVAERIAESITTAWPGVKAMYIMGSTKNATARAHSDIDLLIHFDGDAEERADLQKWLDGWSLALDEINYQRTGYRRGRLLNVSYVSSEEISRGEGMAGKIDAVTAAARPLPLGRG